MGLRALMQVVGRRWRWVVVLPVLGLLVGGGAAVVATPTYRSTASVFFSLQYGGSASDLVQGSTYTQNQVASFAALATTPAVLQPVVDRLDIPVSVGSLAGRVSAQAPLDTVIVEVTAVDTSPARAALIANAVATSLGDRVEALAPTDDQGAPSIEATVVAPAVAPAGAATPNVPLNLVAGLLGGLVLGLAGAFARDALDSRVRDAGALASVTPLPIMGLIARRSARVEDAVVVESSPSDPQAESFRQLRTNLRFVELPGAEGPGDRTISVIAITSSLAAEGKSTVAANLAAALAETGSRVLLVDADLRRPSLARVLGLEGGAGLTTVLAGIADLDEVVQDWGGSGLQVLASGVLPPNPSEVLGSVAMARLLSEMRAAYDYVIIDTAPLLPVADAAILSRLTDGMLVVADVTAVRRHQLTEGLDNLQHVSARVLGVVLNRLERDEFSYDYRDPATAPVSTRGRLASLRRRPRARRSRNDPEVTGSGGGRPVSAATEPVLVEPLHEADVAASPAVPLAPPGVVFPVDDRESAERGVAGTDVDGAGAGDPDEAPNDAAAHDATLNGAPLNGAPRAPGSSRSFAARASVAGGARPSSIVSPLSLIGSGRKMKRSR
jgi:succinoglycan biosynthesis transport protein ExoP